MKVAANGANSRRLTPEDLRHLDAAAANIEAAICRFEELVAGLRKGLAVMLAMRASGRSSPADQAALAAAFVRDWRGMAAVAEQAWRRPN